MARKCGWCDGTQDVQFGLRSTNVDGTDFKGYLCNNCRECDLEEAKN